MLGSDAWRPAFLAPESSVYGSFWFAWRNQRNWGPTEHEQFWRMHLGLWPRARGQQTPAEIIRTIAELQATGLTRSQVERKIGYAPGGLSTEAWDRGARQRRSEPIRAGSLHAQYALEDALTERQRIAMRESWRTPRVVRADEWTEFSPAALSHPLA